jgi:hypothetical protein
MYEEKKRVCASVVPAALGLLSLPPARKSSMASGSESADTLLRKRESRGRGRVRLPSLTRS